MALSRQLDYCGVRSLVGREAADEMFGRKLPVGFDMDQPGDEEMVTAIVADDAKCESCPDRHRCHD
jgi:hypothetical protein